MLRIAKKAVKLPFFIYQSLTKLFSDSELSEKDLEKIDQIAEKIVNGEKLKKPFYE